MCLRVIIEKKYSSIAIGFGSHDSFVKMNRRLGDMGEERSMQMAAMKPGRQVAAVRNVGVSVHRNHLI